MVCVIVGGSYDQRVMGALASHDEIVQGVRRHKVDFARLVWVGVCGSVTLDLLPCSDDDCTSGVLAQQDMDFLPFER